MSTSEFQKVKKYMLRFSNAKATVAGDIDENQNDSRPTLKKRQPDQDPNAPSTTTTEEPKKDAPPQLKKRGETTTQPQTQPTPQTR